MARTTRIAALVATILLVGGGLSVAAEAAPPGAAQTVAQTVAKRAVLFGGNGLKVKLNHHPAALERTSPAFRRFVDRELRDLWSWTDRAPECRRAPVVFVKEYRRTVAYLNEGSYAVTGHPECAGGGNWQFAVRRDGRWVSPRALGGQDVPSCHRLRRWDIPRMTGAKQCYDGTDVVDYHHPRRAW